MDVHDRLPRNFTNVDTDVVTGGNIFFVDMVFRLIQQEQHGGFLRLGGEEEIGNMTSGNDQEMAGVDREFVLLYIGQIIPEQDTIRMTERTVLIVVVHGASYLLITG